MSAPIRDTFDCSSRKPTRRHFVSGFPRALSHTQKRRALGLRLTAVRVRKSCKAFTTNSNLAFAVNPMLMARFSIAFTRNKKKNKTISSPVTSTKRLANILKPLRWLWRKKSELDKSTVVLTWVGSPAQSQNRSRENQSSRPWKNKTEAVTRDMATSDWLKLAAICLFRGKCIQK